MAERTVVVSVLKPRPCLTRINGVTCHGTLLPVTAREWRCTEGHTMWGTSALRSQPWPADRPHRPWFARLRARIFGRSNSVHPGRDAGAPNGSQGRSS